MKQTNWFIKILIILPLLILILLLSWMTMDWWKSNHGGENEKEKESVSVTETAATTEAVLQLDVPEVETELLTEAQDPIRHLLFGGDVLLSAHVTKAYDNAGGIQGVLDEGYRREIDRSDLFMVNQEFPFSDNGTAAADKQFTFRLPPSRVSMMKELGIDIVTLANNHTLDYGEAALLDNCKVLDDAGILYVGAGSDLDRAKQLKTVDVRGKVIGFLAASRVYPDSSWAAGASKPGMVSGYDPKILLEEIKKAGNYCDYLVVYVHWGIEKADKPQEYQRVLGKQIIDAGADLVIGSHPHVLQGIEYYNGKPIVYSLGNFVFGSSIPKTVLLRADVDLSQDNVILSLIPGKSGAGYTKELTEPGEIQEFYQYMQGISFGITIDENGVVQPN